MSQTFVPPQHKSSAFTCPHCNVHAHQFWSGGVVEFYSAPATPLTNDFGFSKCNHCRNVSFWVSRVLVHPTNTVGPLPNPDMPEDIKLDFDEARQIGGLSPRGAAALLRLCVQKICKHLGEKGKNINDDIGSLVSKGLNPEMQRAFDSVRIIGNKAVHPGELNINDNAEMVAALFEIVNMIVEELISKKKKIAALYDMLPPDSLAAIQDRDNPKS